MRRLFAAAAVAMATALLTGPASSLATFTIAQNSGLFKKQGCGSDPTNCTWCTKNHNCYNVTGCKDGKCSVVSVAPKHPTQNKPGQVKPKPVSVSGGQPTTAKPVTNVHPNGGGGSKGK